MVTLENKNVLVVGLGVSGIAASELCLARGARVVAVDGADTPALRNGASRRTCNWARARCR
jgi:UDP-N-acetylmuramoylalanine--D-glutamate ligase